MTGKTSNYLVLGLAYFDGKWRVLGSYKLRNDKKVRAAIQKQLGYVRRDHGYLEQFMSNGCIPDKKEIPKYLTILKLYEQ